MTFPNRNSYRRGIIAMTQTPGQPDGQTVRRMFTSHYTCLHGIDPRRVMLVRDEITSALFIRITGTDIDIRLDLDAGPAMLRRDRDGLARLAEVAAEAVTELTERLSAVTA